MAGRKARQGQTATRSRGKQKNDQTWLLDDKAPIQGATTVMKGPERGKRVYLVRWQDKNPDAPEDEHWETNEYYSSFCVGGNISARVCRAASMNSHTAAPTAPHQSSR